MILVFLLSLGITVAEECHWNYGVPGESNVVTRDDNERDLIREGGKAGTDEYPWHVLVLAWPDDASTSDTDATMCGGTIISKDWILTAAQCCHDHVPDENATLTVRCAPDIHHRVTVVAGGGKIIRNGTLIPHADFHADFDESIPYHYIDSDIALIRLNESLPCDDKRVNAISLAKESTFNFDYCAAWLLGYGFLADDGPLPEHAFEWLQEFLADPSTTPQLDVPLHEVQTRVWKRETCNTHNHVTKAMRYNTICGYSMRYTSKESTCDGDQGGSFSIDVDRSSTKHKYVQIGITSASAVWNCKCGESVGIYTHVSKYEAWIKAHVPTAKFEKITQCDEEHYQEGVGKNLCTHTVTYSDKHEDSHTASWVGNKRNMRGDNFDTCVGPDMLDCTTPTEYNEELCRKVNDCHNTYSLKTRVLIVDNDIVAAGSCCNTFNKVLKIKTDCHEDADESYSLKTCGKRAAFDESLMKEGWHWYYWVLLVIGGLVALSLMKRLLIANHRKPNVVGARKHRGSNHWVDQVSRRETARQEAYKAQKAQGERETTEDMRSSVLWFQKTASQPIYMWTVLVLAVSVAAVYILRK